MPPQVNVILGQQAAEQIKAHAISNLRTELGGALLGKAYQHNGTIFVEIEAALPAQSGDHGPVHFTFSADSWRQLQSDKEASYPQLDMVGWFHTHPGLGVFYSGDDVVVHSAAFTLPWHVGLVVDPVRNEACFFGWADGDLIPFSGFYERADGAKTAVPWQVVRTSVWQAPYKQEGVTDTRTGVYLPPQTAVTSSFWVVAAAAIGAAGVLLAFFLLVAGILPLNRQVQSLEQAVMVLAEQTAVNTAVCPSANLRMLSPIDGDAFSLGAVVPVIGTTNMPEAARYRLEVRLAGTTNWLLIDDWTRDETLDTLVTWDTTPHRPGTYEMRVTAVDRNNIQLTTAAPCQLTIELHP
ncbi:MAG: hypothetical protein Kow0080_35350 [Candidatus Promineifilaceae bacterium]